MENIKTDITIVSFRRTGTHWLNESIKKYFGYNKISIDKNEQQVFDQKFNHGYEWKMEHDKDLSLKPVGNVIYLFRDPVDTLYSLSEVLLNHPDDNKEKNMLLEELVYKHTKMYKNHLKKLYCLFQKRMIKKKQERYLLQLPKKKLLKKVQK